VTVLDVGAVFESALVNEGLERLTLASRAFLIRSIWETNDDSVLLGIEIMPSVAAKATEIVGRATETGIRAAPLDD